MNFLNTHNYDGNIDFNIPESIKLIPFEIKKRKIIEERENVKAKISDRAFDFFDQSLKELDSVNFDDKNNIFYIDVLYMCCVHFKEDDFMILFSDQFEDMSTGFCIQGRTTRLIQLLKAF